MKLKQHKNRECLRSLFVLLRFLVEVVSVVNTFFHFSPIVEEDKAI